MSQRILLFANYREIVGSKEIIIEMPDSTVRDVVDWITEQYPDLIPLLFKDKELKRYVNILINGTSFRDLNGMETHVADGDVIKLFPPVSGG